MNAPLGWFGIVRLGLVQAALGSVVVLCTATLNRVMVVELALPAILPGALVALHYGVQVLRPLLGHGSDVGRRRTPWIIGGMAALALGGVGAACGTALMASHLWAGVALAVAAFVLVGLGVGAAGTSLLVLMAGRVDARRRAPAATVLWLLMIAGIVLTAGVASHLLDPFSPHRLVAVFALTPGQSAGLTGLHHAGVLVGMAAVALCCLFAGEFRTRAMRLWTIGGCCASALALAGMAAAALVGPAWPLHASVVALGAANGAFAVSAIGAMMGLASAGRERREGVRVGLWGAAQAVAFGAGGLFGTGLIDAARLLLGALGLAYAAVFAAQATVFLIAARLAAGVFQMRARSAAPALAAAA